MRKKNVAFTILFLLVFTLVGCNGAVEHRPEEAYVTEVDSKENIEVEEEGDELINNHQNDPFFMYVDDFNKGKEFNTNYICVKKGEQYYSNSPCAEVQNDDVWNYATRYDYEYQNGSLIKEEKLCPIFYSATSSHAYSGYYYTNSETPFLTVQKGKDKIIGCFKKDIINLDLYRVFQDGYTIPALIDEYYTFYEDGDGYYIFVYDQYNSREITDFNGNIINPNEYGNYEKDKKYNICLHMGNNDYSVSLVADRPLYKTEQEVAYSIKANPLGDGSYVFDIQDVEPGLYFARYLGIIKIE